MREKTNENQIHPVRTFNQAGPTGYKHRSSLYWQKNRANSRVFKIPGGGWGWGGVGGGVSGMWKGWREVCLRLLDIHCIRGQVPLAASVWILLIAVLFSWAGLYTGAMMILLKTTSGTSLGAQWLRIHLPMQGTRVQSLKIPHAAEQLSPCVTTTEPALWSPRATITEPVCHNYWSLRA